MYKLLVFLIISLFFTSCSSKNSAFRYFENSDIETKAVQYTKKIDILKEKEVDTILIATYLNKIDEKLLNEKVETFLVFTYFSNKEIQDLKDNKSYFLLNGEEAILVEKIEKDNNEFRNLMLKNHWGSYYLVKFNSDENTNKLKLELINQESSRAILNFEK